MFWYLSLIIPAVLAVAGLKTEMLILKMAATLLCAALVIARNILFTRKPSFRWLVMALGFSAAGDFFMTAKGSRTSWFVIGILLFLMAHAGYFLYSLTFRKTDKFSGRVFVSVLILLLIPYALYFILKLLPSISAPALAAAAFVYLIISCFAFAAAAARREKLLPYILYQTVITLILFSDTIISLTEFCGYDGLNFLMLPTYYAAHLLVAGYVMVRREYERR